MKREGRNHIPRRPMEESNWYLRYLSPASRLSIIAGESADDDCSTPSDVKIADEFFNTFRVYWSVFQDLKRIVLEQNIHDPQKKDIMGHSSNVELLILGVLFYCGFDTTFTFLYSQTNIDAETHRTFHHKVTGAFYNMKDQYIYLPRTEEELSFVAGEYDAVGFPGCAGSIDVVHFAWGNCPHAWLPIYKGKEAVPTIGFQVVVTNRRFIQHVSDGFPGTWNDSCSVKYDCAVKGLQPGGSSWLRSVKWAVLTDSGTECFEGCYFICDGGYLRWQSLVSPYEVPSVKKLEKYRGILAAVRKDVECTFGGMKKKFRSLKGWTSFKTVKNIQNHVVFCCILHNIMLKANGYLDVHYEHKGGVMQQIKRRFQKYNTDCDGCFVRANRSSQSPVTDTTKQKNEWKRRVLAIASHQTILANRN